MKKIITLTLNPSLDETLITRHLNIGYYNHVTATKHLDASGRGVNVSRALVRLGTPTHAVIVLGNDTVGRAYKSLIMEEAFPTKIIGYPGPTRSDTIIVDIGQQKETHILDEDSVGPRNNLDALTEAVTKIIEPEDVVLCAGNLPRDSASDVYAQLINSAHQAGAQAILMTRGKALKEGLKAAPETVVLMQREEEALFNYPIRTLDDIRSSAWKLQEQGCKRVITVMNDYSSVVFVEQDNVWVARISDLDFKGTHSGVVDAMLAGYLTGWMEGRGAKGSCKLAAAALSYAAQQIGNEFGNIEQLQPHLYNVRVQHDRLRDEVST